MAGASQGIWNVDWLNENSQRKFPLADDATLIDTSGSFKLPSEFIVDLLWPVQSFVSLDISKFHLIGVSIFGGGVTVSIGYDGTVIGSATIADDGFERNSVYKIQGVGDFYDTVGKIIIGSLDNIKESAGSFTFDLAGGRLIPTVVVPYLRQVSALYIKNGDDVSGPYQGDVIIEAGKNMIISVEPGAVAEPARFVFSAIDGSELNQDCDCDENRNLPCIKTINGIGPNPEDNNFTLLGDDCIELAEIANGVSLTEKCAKPCCGCDELKVVKDTNDFIIQQIQSLENLASRMETALDVVTLNLLASKTGNQT